MPNVILKAPFINKKMWEFEDGTKLNSQIWVRSKINLHKPKKKKLIKLKAKWCMDKPWTTQNFKIP
jgi:hypothetical protein